jgi:signal transduction histidine kinase
MKLEVKFKNIFLSSMSHNLKTPINSKNLFINLLGLIINNEILCTRVNKDIDPLSSNIIR